MLRLRSRRVPAGISSAGLLLSGAPEKALLAGSLALELRALLPNIQIVAFARHSSWSAANLLHGIDDILVLPDKHPTAAVRMIRRHSPDLLIDASGSLASALITGMSTARYTIGICPDWAPRKFLYDVSIAPDRTETYSHAIKRLTRPLGGDAEGIPTLNPSIFSDARMDSRDNLVVLHPWSTMNPRSRRGLPDVFWANLASVLVRDGYNIAITGNTEHYQRAKALAELVDNSSVKVLVGRTTLRQIASLITGARAVVGVPSDALQIADILGTPSVALADRGALSWGALGENSVTLDWTSKPRTGPEKRPTDSTAFSLDLSDSLTFDVLEECRSMILRRESAQNSMIRTASSAPKPA